jgi:EpsI family protein
MRPAPIRFWIAFLLLATSSWFLYARVRNEALPPHLVLSRFPMSLGSWTGVDIAIDDDTRSVLGSGDFLLRRYFPEDTDQQFADLFIAFFPTQRTGDTMHSPQHCLPGSGWYAVSNRIVTLQFPGSGPMTMNEYVVSNGSERRLVLYWYYSHGNAIASEYRSKIQLVVDSMRMNRSDGSLIRLSTRMYEHETTEEAMQRLKPFADLVVPLLDSYIPR